MTYRQLRVRAWKEWRGSARVRREYPTYVHYWRERYQRVYRLEVDLPARGAP